MNQNLPLRYALSEPPPMGIANQNPSLETANENPSERQPIRTPLRDSQSEPLSETANQSLRGGT